MTISDFTSVQLASSPILICHHHHHIFHAPHSPPAAVSTSAESHLPQIPTSRRRFDNYDTDQAVVSRYDFTPLLTFLSSSAHEVTDSSPPTSLYPAEFHLAESYRAVPAPLWHSLLKSLCSWSSSSSLKQAYALVSWLQKHNLCFSYELLYSILIHALGRSEKIYEAFLLSQRQTLTPLTYNALIGACARNGDLEKALNLMSRMRQDGYRSDFVNYSLVIQSLNRSNKVDSPIMLKLYREIESGNVEIDGQKLIGLFN